MSEVPLTPRQLPHSVLKILRSCTTGRIYIWRSFPIGYRKRAAAKAERRRRRHEKEDAVARKVGGFWRGRGCIPASGCYGRPGREGRKRRRICLGVIGGSLRWLFSSWCSRLR